MILVGLASVLGSLRFRIGTLQQMGPGYFPIVIGGLMTIAGLGIVLQAALSTDKGDPMKKPDWRGCICIIGGMLAFIGLGMYTGLVPATFAIVFISCFGDKTNTVKQAFVLSSAMSVISAVVFRWILGLPLPLFGWR